MALNPNRITGADVHMADSLVMAIVNDGGSNERWINHLAFLRRNLVKKAQKGVYDAVLTGRLWRYAIEEYLPTFQRDEGPVGRVDVPTRNLAGRFLEENQRERVFSDAGIPEPSFPSDAELRAIENGDTLPTSGNAPVLSSTSDASGLAPMMGGK